MQYHEVLYHLQGDSDLVFPELCEANQYIRVSPCVCDGSEMFVGRD